MNRTASCDGAGSRWGLNGLAAACPSCGLTARQLGRSPALALQPPTHLWPRYEGTVPAHAEA